MASRVARSEPVLIMSNEDQTEYGRLFGVLGRLTGLFAAVVAAIYFTGGLVLSLRLGLERLPSTAAVAQLPREFLISLGLTVMVPAIGVGMLGWWLARRHWRTHGRAAGAGIALGVLCYLAIAGVQVAKSPFPAKVCVAGGGEASGVFIGETDGRTYLGDPSSQHPRRIISIPLARVERTVVGGDESELRRVSCDVGSPRA